MAKIKHDGVVYTVKSDAARAMLNSGMKITEIVTETTRQKAPMGYAFVYGVAKRAGKAATAADRKPAKTVTIVENTAVIRTAAGTVKINLETGKIVK